MRAVGSRDEDSSIRWHHLSLWASSVNTLTASSQRSHFLYASSKLFNAQEHRLSSHLECQLSDILKTPQKWLKLLHVFNFIHKNSSKLNLEESQKAFYLKGKVTVPGPYAVV